MSIKVILDTDIGSDIDDTWALVFLLKCKEISLQLITTCTGDTLYRAKLTAKLLEVANRTDIPIGIGIKDPKMSDKYNGNKYRYQQLNWLENFKFDQYKGKVFEDGVQSIIDTIMNIPENEDIVVLSIGPCPNIAAALKKKPEIAHRSRFVGMHGSVFRGYQGDNCPTPEYNVASFSQDAYDVFIAGWKSITITPLDTCGIVTLQGPLYKMVFESKDPIVKALIENYFCWFKKISQSGGFAYYCDTRSSTLYDTVAILLLLPQHIKFLEMQTHPIIVDIPTGHTLIDREKGKPINVAVNWKDLNGFEKFLVSKLIGNNQEEVEENLVEKK